MAQANVAMADTGENRRYDGGGGRHGIPDSGGKRRMEQRIAICDRLTDIAAAFFSICGKELRHPGRSRTEVARVRQIAMYVAHVTLGMTMTDVGRGFGRDRTTVMHACHLIEDMRDDEDFDRIVQRFEKIARVAFAGHEACQRAAHPKTRIRMHAASPASTSPNRRWRWCTGPAPGMAPPI